MNYDRFKFRVWDKREGRYTSAPNPSPLLQSNGLLAYFKDEKPMENYIVEQCTGLKDKNGKLVFDGDFIFINGEKWRVIWNDEDCAFFFSNLKEVYHQPVFPDFYLMADDFEVIGNIHENAELVK